MTSGTAATLHLRPRHPLDDAFLFELSERLFAPFSARVAQDMAHMLGDPFAHTRVALEENAPVGFFVVEVEAYGRPYGPYTAPALARLNAIGVDPRAQRRGIGRFLLIAAEQLAIRLGAVGMTLTTAETNYRARELFESAGYARVFVHSDAYRGGQRGVVMNKALAP